MKVPSRWVAPVAFAAAALVAVAGGTAYLLQDRSHPPAQTQSIGGLPTTALDAQLHGCARPAAPTASGAQVFAITNRSARALEITLAGPDRRVYAELEGVGPASTRLMQVSLAGGTYHFECYFTEVDAIAGDPFTVTGPPATAAGVVPLSTQALTPVTLAYQAWIAGQLPLLAAQVRTLASAPDIASQRTAWLAAHHRYETLGAAYDAFGDWDDKINGPDTGFHQVEAALWAASPTVPAAAERTLLTDVDGLTKDFPNIAVDPLQIGLRAHEITENTIEFTLTGEDDHGSHASLDTALANLTGTRQLIDRLTPLLTTRYPALPQTRQALDRAETITRELAAQYPGRPISEFAQIDRERLDSAFGGLVELLAPIAAITDVRRTH